MSFRIDIHFEYKTDAMQALAKLLKISDNTLSRYELKKVQQLNLIAGYCIILGMFLNIVNLVIQNYPNFFIMLGVSVAIFFPTILLQKRKKYAFARLYFWSLLYLAMIFASVYHIQHKEFIHSENIFLVLSPICVILFEKKIKSGLYLLTITTFFAVRLYDHYARGINLSNDFLSSSTIYLVVFLAIYYMVNSYMLAFHRIYQHQLVLTERLNEQKNRLEKSNATKNKLFSIISHDLKRPVYMLTGLLDAEDELPKETLEQHKTSVKENVALVNSLVETILAWAKSQLEGFKISLEDLNLDQLLTNEINNFRQQAREKNINIVRSEQTNLIIRSDPNHVTLVIRNILNNCIKFTPPNGEIIIQVNSYQYHVDIVIQDTGMGMSAETIKAILSGKLTKVASGTSGESGTGLGLALCMDTLEKIGGTLHIESDINQGSQFTIQLSKSISST